MYYTRLIYMYSYVHVIGFASISAVSPGDLGANPSRIRGSYILYIIFIRVLTKKNCASLTPTYKRIVLEKRKKEKEN